MEDVMLDKKLIAVAYGILFIGGAAVLLGFIGQAKSPVEHVPGCILQESDGETFVYGAHA